MKKKLFFTLTLCYLFSSILNAQNKLHVTDSLRTAGNYNLELKYHLLIYKDDPKFLANIYNMSCCYSLLKNSDSAFYYLNIAIDLGQNDGWALADYDLRNLHSEKRWKEIEKKLEKIYKEKDTTINVQLGWEISKMYFEDQAPKLASDNIMVKYGIESPQMDSINRIIATTDSINMLKLEKIIGQYGWTDKRLVGEDGASKSFIIFLHAPLTYQKKYFKFIEDAANKGDIEKQSIAYLTDKILNKEGKKQLYCTQLKYSIKTHSYELKPIEDEKNVNVRRLSMGMQPIEEYAKNWGINYKQ
jgi:hypothetical protein